MKTNEYMSHYNTAPDYIDEDGNVYSEDELVEFYDDMLNESGPVTIGGLSYEHSEAFKAVDPIAYRCGMIDYQDSLGWDEWTQDHEWNERDEDEDEEAACEDCGREDRPLSFGDDGYTYCDRHIDGHTS